MSLLDSSEQFLEINFVDTEQTGNHSRQKLLPFDTGVLQGASLFFSERVHFLADHAAHAFRQFQLHL